MLQRGEEVIIGLGVEETRGTAVAPQVFIPGRTPTGIAPVVEKVAMKETRGSKIASHAIEITQKRAEGDLEFNVRSNSIGYILKSLFGSLESAPVGGQSGVYTHTINVLESNPEHPSLTLALSQPQVQDYKYKLAVVSALSLDITPDDLIVGTASFIASNEEEATPDYEPAFSDDDVLFRHQDIAIKLADTEAGLGAATALKVKNFKLDLPNGARVDQNVSELNPGNILASTFEMKGSFELDLESTDLHDAYFGGDYQALQITIERTDVTIGSTAHPKLVITFPKISIDKWTPNRPIDDVVREQIDFVIHYDESSSKAVHAELTNTVAAYTESES